MDWLRLWHDMPNDPKWRTIARISGEPVSLVLAVYLHMLVDGSRNVTRGHVTVTKEDLASALDVTDENIANIQAAMEGRVMENGRLLGWDKRQPKREDSGNPETGAKSSAQRKAEQRERDRLAKAAAELLAKSGGVTLGHDASRNVTTDKRRLDKKKEREAAGSVDKSDTENRATRLSLDFEFPESWQAWARTARAEVKDPKAVFRKFITLYADGEAKPPEVWTSMFRSFLLNERIPVDPATAANEDPDTRPNVEKRGVAVGIGKWDDSAEQWPQYKARVQAAEREAEPHGA
jgi:hypothetical protein